MQLQRLVRPCGAISGDGIRLRFQPAADDGRSRCGSAENPCRATFRALAEDAHRFDGRMVRMEGYLGVSRGNFVLSASKELHEAGVTGEVDVRIRGRLEDQERIFKAYAYSWVVAEGTFRTVKKDGTTQDLLLGDLFVTDQVRPLMAGSEYRRQEFGEVLLELQDLNPQATE